MSLLTVITIRHSCSCSRHTQWCMCHQDTAWSLWRGRRRSTSTSVTALQLRSGCGADTILPSGRSRIGTSHCPRVNFILTKNGDTVSAHNVSSSLFYFVSAVTFLLLILNFCKLSYPTLTMLAVHLSLSTSLYFIVISIIIITGSDVM